MRAFLGHGHCRIKYLVLAVLYTGSLSHEFLFSSNNTNRRVVRVVFNVSSLQLWETDVYSSVFHFHSEARKYVEQLQ